MPTDADTEAGRGEGLDEIVDLVAEHDQYGDEVNRENVVTRLRYVLSCYRENLRRLRQSDPGGERDLRRLREALEPFAEIGREMEESLSVMDARDPMDLVGVHYRGTIFGPMRAYHWTNAALALKYAAAPTDEAPEGDCICVEPSPHLPGDTGVVMECSVHGEVAPPVEEGERGEDRVGVEEATTDEALQAVLAERVMQDEKWGDVEDRTHLSLGDLLAILTEEVGELAEAVLEFRYGDDQSSNIGLDMRDEAVQVAAVGLFIVEWLDLARLRAPQGEGERDDG